MDTDTHEEEPTLEERTATAVAVAYGQQGYINEEGGVDDVAVISLLTSMAIEAVATKKNERAKVCVTRRDIMLRIFPKVAGPEGWADEEDPELAEKVYKTLDSACWRLTATSPTGPIQEQLNSEHALVLCRTKVNPHKTDAIYTTRDLGCLLEDAIKPQKVKEVQRLNREAAFTAMLMERVPEHGKRINREFVGGLKTAMDGAKAITTGTLHAIIAESDNDDGDQ